MVNKFDDLWGAGRLKVRLFYRFGMDAPWSWSTGTRCVGNQDDIYLNLNNGNAIPTDVDMLKAVIWWYDKRHEDGIKIDDIDLVLQRKDSLGVYRSVRYSADANDNKERVVWHDFNELSSYRLKINGYDVSADNAGCGDNKMKVFYAYYFEDSDRDDDNGPAWNAETLIGVEPQGENTPL